MQPPSIYTLSLHDALPISDSGSTFDVVVSNSAGTATSNAATLTVNAAAVAPTITTQPVNQTVTASQAATFSVTATGRSEEHTSELQSHHDLVCRLLLEKKK